MSREQLEALKKKPMFAGKQHIAAWIKVSPEGELLILVDKKNGFPVLDPRNLPQGGQFKIATSAQGATGGYATMYEAHLVEDGEKLPTDYEFLPLRNVLQQYGAYPVMKDILHAIPDLLHKCIYELTNNAGTRLYADQLLLDFRGHDEYALLQKLTTIIIVKDQPTKQDSATESCTVASSCHTPLSVQENEALLIKHKLAFLGISLCSQSDNSAFALLQNLYKYPECATYLDTVLTKLVELWRPGRLAAINQLEINNVIAQPECKDLRKKTDSFFGNSFYKEFDRLFTTKSKSGVYSAQQCMFDQFQKQCRMQQEEARQRQLQMQQAQMQQQAAQRSICTTPSTNPMNVVPYYQQPQQGSVTEGLQSLIKARQQMIRTMCSSTSNQPQQHPLQPQLPPQQYYPVLYTAAPYAAFYQPQPQPQPQQQEQQGQPQQQGQPPQKR